MFCLSTIIAYLIEITHNANFNITKIIARMRIIIQIYLWFKSILCNVASSNINQTIKGVQITLDTGFLCVPFAKFAITPLKWRLFANNRAYILVKFV